MNFNSIRFRYTAFFCGIGVIFILSAFLYTKLIAKTEEGMTQIGQTFNLAISSVLNADRDLYQARVAELSILQNTTVDEQFKNHKVMFEENAKQALDRMEDYRRLMKDYPDILVKLNAFKGAYDNWLSSARRVFELVEQGQLASAKTLSDSDVLTKFETLREYYNTAGEDADKASADLSRETIGSVSKGTIALSIFSLIVVTLTFAVGTLGPKSLSNLILTLSDEIKGLNSGDGDLTRRINSQRTDEIGQLANDFDELIGGLADLIRSILEQSRSVIGGVENLDSGVKSVQVTSQQQTDKVDSIVTAVNELSFAVKEVAQTAVSTSDQIDEVNRLTQEGSSVTKITVAEMEGLSQTIDTAAEVIGQLSEYSNDIASVLDVIKSIAEQTNLLALNAAIEAARAGEQGRGFAVVADEVRSLASRTQESTQSIQEMIENLQTGVKKAVQSINDGSQGAISTADKAKQALVSLDDIATACNKVSNMAAQTATATEEQAQVAHDISQNLTILSDHTNNNFDVAKRNSEQACQTMALARQLSHSVERFKLD
ncbi:methyl-accepting chemotaxis protein [Thalassotalea sp. LPB0316]|uniref:methyl-accepting chemotaxis protein n=1 Tax=Thalassotalea sp. LPB0316 TaxID=2769490 RepID=UPI0018662EA2|nr:methyl-accepting chemotaxis protein [Thalassotalea sp. LPB0316]QOL25231.1 methyl-accepting chemotaxis protein [Thalassotalea sp. LPB0316]